MVWFSWMKSEGQLQAWLYSVTQTIMPLGWAEVSCVIGVQCALLFSQTMGEL